MPTFGEQWPTRCGRVGAEGFTNNARWLTNVATLAFGAGWIMRFGEQAPRIGLATLASTWLLVHAEAWFTARRADRSDSAELTEVDLLSLLNDPSYAAYFPGAVLKRRY